MTDLLRTGKQSRRAVDHHLCAICSCKMLQAEREAFHHGIKVETAGYMPYLVTAGKGIITSRITAPSLR